MFSVFDNFRLNAENIGSVGMIIFSFVGAIFLHRQNKQIWRAKSGQAVSVKWMEYFFCMQVTIFFYGLYMDRFPLIVNGLVRGIFYPFILIGLWRFKGFTRMERWLFLFFIAATLGFILSPAVYRQPYFLLFGLGFIVMTLAQTWELYCVKSPGVLNIWMLWTFNMASVFWTIYGMAIRDWALQLMNLPVTIILSLTIVLWYYYYPRRNLNKL